MTIQRGMVGRARSRVTAGRSTPAETDRVRALALHKRPGRNALLVIADEPIRSELVALGGQANLEVYPCTSADEAIAVIEKVRDRVACAVIASTPPWCLELRRRLAVDYPDVESIMVLV